MNLSKEARKKLGNLVGQAEQTVRDLIRTRGGNAANVRKVGPWADRSLGETAEAAAQGDRSAETAIKIVKQARKKGEQH